MITYQEFLAWDAIQKQLESRAVEVFRILQPIIKAYGYGQVNWDYQLNYIDHDKTGFVAYNFGEDTLYEFDTELLFCTDDELQMHIDDELAKEAWMKETEKGTRIYDGY